MIRPQPSQPLLRWPKMRRVLAAAFALCIATSAFAQSGLLPANQVWAGPPSGGQGFARARALVGADVPAPGASSLGGVQSLTCSSSNWFRTLSTSGVLGCSQPAITDISGLGAGVATALGIAPGSAGAPVLFNGAGGTPSSLVATNATGTAAGLTAGHTSINANLTGDVTSVGNATTYNNVVPAAKGGWGSVGAWGVTTPTPTCNAGSGTWTGTVINSKTIDKTTLISVHLVLSAIGTCSGVITVAIPVAAPASSGATAMIRENALTGTAYQGWVSPGSTNLIIGTMAGGGPTLASGDIFIGSLVMQNQ